MRWWFAILAVMGLLVGPGCGSSDSGSSVPSLDPSGCWGCLSDGAGNPRPRGTFTADADSSVAEFKLTFEAKGDVASGAFFADLKFVKPAGMPLNKFCFVNKTVQWSGTLRVDKMRGIAREPNDNAIELQLVFVDANTAIGTYEIIDGNGSCVGRTGVISLLRSVPI